jgi:hypothetical protein
MDATPHEDFEAHEAREGSPGNLFVVVIEVFAFIVDRPSAVLQ